MLLKNNPIPQARRAAARARRTLIPQTQLDETTENARKNDKPVDSNSCLRSILNEYTSDSDPDSKKQIPSHKDISGRDDTSDSNPESTKHQKSSSHNKPAQRQQIPSNKIVSGHDDARHKSKTKLFKTKTKETRQWPQV
jgi:hypothetical protein